VLASTHIHRIPQRDIKLDWDSRFSERILAVMELSSTTQALTETKPAEMTVKQILWRSVALVFRSAPREIVNLLLLNLVLGAGPSIALYFGKVVIDEVTRLLAINSPGNPLPLLLNNPLLLTAIGITLLLNIAVDSLQPVQTSVFSALRDRVKGYSQGQMLEKVGNFNDIALFENPEWLNLITLAEEKSLYKLQEITFKRLCCMNQ
jgi:ATP-binding cassette subfamily B protein